MMGTCAPSTGAWEVCSSEQLAQRWALCPKGFPGVESSPVQVAGRAARGGFVPCP